MRKIKSVLKDKILMNLYGMVSPTRYKEHYELAYWRGRAASEGQLNNQHYAYFYTTFFSLEASYYEGKRILDIGCGPRGSLEWASMAEERVGIDPLVPKYLKLGADKHQMTYIAAPSEQIPFPDAHFDVVCAFNSLDHVESYEMTRSEIKRLVKPGGYFLLIVEVNHKPSRTEPVSLPWTMTNDFTDAFEVLETGRFEIGNHDIYGQLRDNQVFDELDTRDREGILTAKMRRRTA